MIDSCRPQRSQDKDKEEDAKRVRVKSQSRMYFSIYRSCLFFFYVLIGLLVYFGKSVDPKRTHIRRLPRHADARIPPREFLDVVSSVRSRLDTRDHIERELHRDVINPGTSSVKVSEALGCSK